MSDPDTPVYAEVVAKLGEPDRVTPCICDHAPDDCTPHPQVRFAPASEWPTTAGEVPQ